MEQGDREAGVRKTVCDATGYGYLAEWVKLHASRNPQNQKSDFIIIKNHKNKQTYRVKQ